jgi:acetyl esterase/lipase
MQESVSISNQGGLKVVTVDYRQAPYFQFPAASEDVEKVYRELLKTYKPSAIGIYGCSAGGFLSAESVAWFQSKGLPRPGAIGIFGSGVRRGIVGTHGDSDIWGLSGTGVEVNPLSSAVTSSSKQAYFSTAKSDDPLAEPGVSDAVIAKFPPTLFVTGTRAMEMSRAVVSHAQLLRLGVDSQLYVMEAAWHCSFVAGAHGTPEAKATNAYIARWFDEHLAR